MSGKALAAVFGALLVGACLGSALSCPPLALCLHALMHTNWPAQSMAAAVLLTVSSTIALALRTVWLVTLARRKIEQIPRAPMSLLLWEAIARTGVQRVECLAAETASAFCAGALRPTIFVSRAVVSRLCPREMDAVLFHEDHHARRLEPLRRAAREAACQIFFYLPVIRWWARHQIEEAELSADRAALEQVGPSPVAGALWVLDSSSALPGAAAFAGVASLRAAQLLGDPLPRRFPSRRLFLGSAAGLGMVLATAACLIQSLIGWTPFS